MVGALGPTICIKYSMTNLIHLLLLWVVWINAHLRSSKEIELRKQHGHSITFSEMISQCSLIEYALLPLYLAGFIYIVTCLLDFLGQCGNAEVQFLQVKFHLLNTL